MAAASGIIARINIKETTPDNYGNTMLKSFKLENDDRWFGLGKSKGDTINIKKGADYVKLAEGDEIEFFYDETEYNGKTYFNAKSSGIKLVAKGTGQAQQQAKPQAKSQAPAAKPASGGSTGGTKAPYEAGIKVGHAINNAVQLAVADGKPITASVLEAKAISILRLSKHLEDNFVSIMDGSYGVQEDKPKAAPKKKPTLPPEPQPPEPEEEPEPQEEKKVLSVADFDDDVPF